MIAQSPAIRFRDRHSIHADRATRVRKQLRRHRPRAGGPQNTVLGICRNAGAGVGVSALAGTNATGPGHSCAKRSSSGGLRPRSVSCSQRTNAPGARSVVRNRARAIRHRSGAPLRIRDLSAPRSAGRGNHPPRLADNWLFVVAGARAAIAQVVTARVVRVLAAR